MNFLKLLLYLVLITSACAKIDPEKTFTVSFKESMILTKANQVDTAYVTFSRNYNNKGKLFFNPSDPKVLEVISSGKDYVVFKTLKAGTCSLEVNLVYNAAINAKSTVSVSSTSNPVLNKIVFERSRSNNSYYRNIFLMSPDGSGLDQISSGYYDDFTSPTIDPLGSKIIYKKTYGELIIHNLTDGTKYNLSSNYTNPEFTRDGLGFSYYYYNNCYTYYLNSGYSYKYTLSNSSYTFELAQQTVSNTGPAVFVTTDYYSSKYYLYYNPGNGGSNIKLDETTSYDQSIANPKFSKDGRYIVYSKGTSSTSDIYLIDTKSSFAKTQLTKGFGKKTHPAFNSSGTQIVYSSTHEYYSPDLYIMTLSDKSIKNITNTVDYSETSPDWN